MDILDVKNMVLELGSKSCGPYSIPTSLLNDNVEVFSNILNTIINLSFSEGSFPELLKYADVCPIYKKKSKDKCENYRPISLLSNISKSFERAMHTRIYDFLESSNIFYELQFGFRKNYSTSHAILDIVENIRENLDNKTFACGVFIDLEKAFDTINHQILLKKLQHYGIRGMTLQWFTSYLSDRKQRVKLDSKKSTFLNITCGVPQGSILGPLLFLLYINDMKDAVKYSILHHFADDTNLLCSNPCEKKLRKNVNQDLKSIFVWLCANRLSLNVEKTEFILFRPPRKNTIGRFTLQLNQKTLFESTKVKYLGMILDKTLSWKHHIVELRKKLSRAIGILYKMKKNYCPSKILVSLCYSLFHSHMNYGLCMYGLANDEYTSRIFLLQKRAIRIISNSLYNAHTDPLFSDLNILPFEKCVEYQLSILMWEFDHGKLPVVFSKYFERAHNKHVYNTRFASSNKMSENRLVNTDLQGKKLLKFLGPRIFNAMVDLEFYKNCNTKPNFKQKMKKYLLSK